MNKEQRKSGCIKGERRVSNDQLQSILQSTGEYSGSPDYFGLLPILYLDYCAKLIVFKVVCGYSQ